MSDPKPFPSSDECSLAMVCHLLTFVGYMMPFGNVIAPLVLWLTKRETSQFIDVHGREVLNFQISILIWSMVSLILSCFLIGIPLLIAIAIFDIVVTIIGALEAQKGRYYRYPLTIRFIE
ncbi:MAG: DUF4870 domain-containing protein [Cyanobacteria bacterium P01_D01_bin.44]